MATNKDNLKAIKASLLQTLADETAYMEAYGPKLDYSLDGESYQWTAFRTAILEQVKNINILIQQEDAPFQIRSRIRT